MPKMYATPLGGHVAYCLCTSRKEVKQVAKQMGFPARLVHPLVAGENAKVSQLSNGICVVVIDLELDAGELLASIVHEATHIKQYYMDFIGEETPSAEFEAYLMQEIFTNLHQSLVESTSTNIKDAVA